MREYNTVTKSASDEIMIEKSRFIGYSFHIDSEQEAEEIIKATKKKHYDANHNCYAYLIGDDMSIARSSDDGEPSYTAGVPMLDVLKKENITNTLIIATRYFGGIKLGTGGLVRAYINTAKIALDANEIVSKKIYEKISVIVDYNFTGKIQKYIEINNIVADTPVFMENVTFVIYGKAEKLETLIEDIINMTNANCTIVKDGLVYRDEIM